MLTTERIESILGMLPRLSIGVVGDLFLDQYLRLDHRLTEPSLETGLDAYQVSRIENSPGAAGTILNNLAALGVGRVKILSILGADGRGYDLKQELLNRKIDLSFLIESKSRQTPTYTKPMLSLPVSPPGRGGEGQSLAERELNRIDIKNRTPTPLALQDQIVDFLPRLWREVDALLVLDQVSEAQCGVVTDIVREKLAELGEDEPQKLLLADSRERIGLFHKCWTKPNAHECLGALGRSRAAPVPSPWMGRGGGDEQGGQPKNLNFAVISLALKTGRPVFCTRGDQGILLANPLARSADDAGSLGLETAHIPGYCVGGPIDSVGAGDSTSAGIACAYAAGASLAQAAAFGNLIASITVQQLGTTGTATPGQVRAMWKVVSK